MSLDDEPKLVGELEQLFLETTILSFGGRFYKWYFHGVLLVRYQL